MTNPVTAEDVVERLLLDLYDSGEPLDLHSLKASLKRCGLALSSTPSDTGDELREALIKCAEALNSFIYIIAHRFDGDGTYYWMRPPTHEEAQAAMEATNNAAAALSKAPQATRSDDGAQWRCVNCKLVTPTKYQIAPERCAECKCSQFAEVAATRSKGLRIVEADPVVLEDDTGAYSSDGEIERRLDVFERVTRLAHTLASDVPVTAEARQHISAAYEELHKARAALNGEG
jgi:hypothetical protein